VILAAGATLNLNYAGTDTVSRLSVNGVFKSAGVYSASNSSYITGAGTLTVLNGSDYDAWAASLGLTGGASGDDDHDGVTNFSEYAFGTDPKNGSSAQSVIVPVDRGTGTLTYTRRTQSLTGLTYTVWYTTDLKAAWTQDAGAVQTVIGSSGNLETVQITLSASLLSNSRLFVRINTSSP
jgi:hypothetical protein